MAVVREIRASDSVPLPPRGQGVNDTPERLTYTVDEVAAVLGLSRSKTYELIARGEIPAVALSSRRKLVARVVVERLLGIEEPSGDGLTGAVSSGPDCQSRCQSTG
jgi:excisionase family DNA binding protein